MSTINSYQSSISSFPKDMPSFLKEGIRYFFIKSGIDKTNDLV
jgi:hypothetical protein